MFRPKFPEAHSRLYESLNWYEAFLRYLCDKLPSETYNKLGNKSIAGLHNIHALCPLDEGVTYLFQKRHWPFAKPIMDL